MLFAEPCCRSVDPPISPDAFATRNKAPLSWVFDLSGRAMHGARRSFDSRKTIPCSCFATVSLTTLNFHIDHSWLFMLCIEPGAPIFFAYLVCLSHPSYAHRLLATSTIVGCLWVIQNRGRFSPFSAFVGLLSQPLSNSQLLQFTLTMVGCL